MRPDYGDGLLGQGARRDEVAKADPFVSPAILFLYGEAAAAEGIDFYGQYFGL